MTKQCVIVGWFGYNNFGDEMILHTLLSHLRSGDFALTVVSKDPKQTEQIHAVNAVPNSWFAFSSLLHADYVIFGGGQILNDNRIRTIPLWSSVLRFIHLLNRDAQIFLLNQGVEAENRVLRRMLGFALSSANLVSVRDCASFKFVSGLNLGVPLFLGPDIVFSCSVCGAENKRVDFSDAGVKKIGVNLRPPFWWRKKSDVDNYAAVLASAFDLLIEKQNVDLVFVPFRLPGKESHSDLDFSEFVGSKMRRSDRTKVFVCALDNCFFSNLVECFSQFDFFIGTSFHSLVLSCKLGVPFLAFSYQKRCEFFMNDLGLAQFVIRDHELASPMLLYSRVCSALRSRNEMRSLLLSKSSELFENSKKAHVAPLCLCRKG